LIGSVQERVTSKTLKFRQREVEQCLSRFGLRAGPHRLGSGEKRIDKLRAALKSLGPVFCTFGLYMSTRVDLLDASDCLQLGSVTGHPQPLSSNLIGDHIKRELGVRSDEVFRDFDERPFVSGLLDQQHCAWLHDGLPVTVKIIRPEVEELISYDTQLLHLLQGAFMGEQGCTSSQIESAMQDFVLTLQQRTNFLDYADALTRLAKDMEVSGMLRVPSVHRQLTTPGILTIDKLPGQTLEHLLTRQTNEFSEDEHYALAHRLCVVWLRQALLGSVFPAEPAPSNITILPTSQIAFTDGALASLPAEAKANLWDYLIAALADDPDRTCSSLLKEMEAGERSVNEVELRRRFRQLVPFRDSDWAYGSDNNNLVEYLIPQWKLINRGGYGPRAHLPSFYRGLFSIACMCRHLTSKGDPLRQALQDVRVLAETEKFRDLLTASRLTEQMDTYLALMMHLPQRLDQALTAVAKREVRAGLQVEAGEIRGKKNSGASKVALWMMLGASVLLVQHFETDLVGSGKGRFEIVILVLLGALLLLSIDRRR
jgi:ubiquinone biosynthesis protein